jgi:hypothetical protein
MLRFNEAKGAELKAALTFLTVVAVSITGGCQGEAAKKELFVVGFQKDQTLRYKFVSSRDIEINWGYTEKSSKRGESKVDKSRESMEMVMAYTPIEINPDGSFATVKATCESVKINRSKGPREDVARSFAGQSFTFTIDATGKIEDYSDLDKLIKATAEKAFRQDRRARIKEREMVGDFIATQWFLWDSVSSIEKPLEGVSVGESWKSKLFLPSPMVMPEARDVTYTLQEIRETEKGRVAVISSTYSPSRPIPSDWPIPYVGRYQVKGTFGFLGGYRVLELQGQGEELFNLDAGRTEQYKQGYKMKVKAMMPLPLPGAKPQVIVDQVLTMQFLGNR